MTEKNMKYKILAFDIDGTLTNSKKEITPDTREAILRAADMGCTIVIATGRPKKGAVKYAEELKLSENGGYILALNGGLLERCEDSFALCKSVIDKSYYREICDMAAEYKVGLMTYDGDDVVSEDVDNQYLQIEARINGLGTKKVADLYEHLDYEVPKFLMLGDGDYLAEVEKKVKKRFEGRLDVYRSEPFFLEILPLNVNKASTLSKLLDYVGATRKELMAFGDGYNDITMIEYAGMGVAMGNANDIVKASADYVTRTNDDGGIAYALSELL